MEKINFEKEKERLKERRIVFLVNPISGGKRKDNIVKLLKEYIAKGNFLWHIFATQKDGNYDLLKEKICKEHITDVVVLGGDGSVSQIVNALRETSVSFGIIPFGSGNGLARTAGIPMNAEKALQIILAGKSSFCDAFMINNAYFGCMLTGLGFDAKIAHAFAKASQRGFFTYLEKVVANFRDAQAYKFEVSTDKAKFCTEAFFISIANANQFGNEVTIAPEASIKDGLLDIVIAQNTNKIKMLGSVIMQLTGQNELQSSIEEGSSKNVFYFQTPKIRIENLSKAPFHIDGEPMDSVEFLDIEIIKDCFRLLQ